jgi:ESS family glutamate:Na+ symporter
VKLDLTQTVAVAGLFLFLGYGIRRVCPPLARLNIPAAVLGGMVASCAILVARGQGTTLFQFDIALRQPLMLAFFAGVGYAASFGLLRTGGRPVMVFLALSSVGAVLQNLLGGGIAAALGEQPLLGVMAGSVTLTGGPATGLAFADKFTRAGLPAAPTIAVAAGMVGIVAGGLLGGPIGTFLIARGRFRTPRSEGGMPAHLPVPVASELVEARVPEPATTPPAGEDAGAYALLKCILWLLLAIWFGSWLIAEFNARVPDNFNLPPTVGAMVVACLVRNLDDLTGWFRISPRQMEDMGSAALSLFIVIALMTLELWKLVDLALPLCAILVAQLVLIAVLSLVVHRCLGSDYEAAVATSGFCGFMLGTTANAMANMTTLVERHGPAPKAFVVVPIVGACFIDFVNMFVISGFLNWWRLE